MMKNIILAFLLFNIHPLLADSEQSPAQISENLSAPNDKALVLFTPPTGWHQADTTLPPHIRVMVIGKGPSTFPPSMNLNVQSFSGTLKDYLKIVKNTNDAQGFEWKDLGSIKTEAGIASLSQFDHKSQWGEIRMMQVILVKDGMVYILSASALKEEFSLFYKDFFASMRSLRITKDPIDMITSSQQKTQLRTAIKDLQAKWKALLAKTNSGDGASQKEVKTTLFNSQDFQTKVWEPYKEMLSQKFGMMGAEWQSIILKETERDLFDL